MWKWITEKRSGSHEWETCGKITLMGYGHSGSLCIRYYLLSLWSGGRCVALWVCGTVGVWWCGCVAECDRGCLAESVLPWGWWNGSLVVKRCLDGERDRQRVQIDDTFIITKHEYCSRWGFINHLFNWRNKNPINNDLIQISYQKSTLEFTNLLIQLDKKIIKYQ